MSLSLFPIYNRPFFPKLTPAVSKITKNISSSLGQSRFAGVCHAYEYVNEHACSGKYVKPGELTLPVSPRGYSWLGFECRVYVSRISLRAGYTIFGSLPSSAFPRLFSPPKITSLAVKSERDCLVTTSAPIRRGLESQACQRDMVELDLSCKGTLYDCGSNPWLVPCVQLQNHFLDLSPYERTLTKVVMSSSPLFLFSDVVSDTSWMTWSYLSVFLRNEVWKGYEWGDRRWKLRVMSLFWLLPAFLLLPNKSGSTIREKRTRSKIRNGTLFFR